MKLFALVVAAFLGAFGIGYVKFFFYRYLGEHVHPEAELTLIIQVVSALMTIGPVLFYPVSAPLAASFSKRYLMSVCSFLIVGLLLIGHMSGWVGSMWLYLFVIGLLISIFGISKVALIPLEANEGKYSTVTVNGIMSIVYVIGLLIGMALGTIVYEKISPDTAFYLGVIIFLLCALVSLIPSYQTEHRKPYLRSVSLLVEDTMRLAFRYPLYVLTSPVLWGVASALTLGITAYVEEKKISGPSGASIIPVFSAFGVIAGNAISTKLNSFRYITATITGLGMSVALFLVPLVVDYGLTITDSPKHMYFPLAAYMVFLGFLFGICSNLIDAEFLQLAAADEREGTGAALQSTALSFFTALVAGFVGISLYFGWINVLTQFMILGCISFIAVILTMVLALQNGFFYGTVGRLIVFVIRVVLKLRYRIKLVNKRASKIRTKGVLILPNHPAEIDPVILCSRLWSRMRVRPVVTESFYYMPGVHQVMKLMRAFPMPDMEKGCGTLKKNRIQRILDEIAQALKEGDNVLIYPSGHLMRSGSEYLGAASGVEKVLSMAPGTNILLVRTKGLWGSSFSTASANGKTPDLFQAFKHAVRVVLANLVFFVPRRNVTLEFHNPDEKLSKFSRLDLNRYLENYYNEGGEEPIKTIPYHCLFGWEVDYNYKQEKKSADLSAYDGVQIAAVIRKFAKSFSLDAENLKIDDQLDADLGLDSLSQSELLVWLDEEYSLSDIDITDLHTVGDVVLVALEGSAKENQSSTQEELNLIEDWMDEGRPVASIPMGKHLIDIFLKKCDEMGQRPALADPLIGILSWNRLKMAVLLFANIIKKWPEEKVGILLPASGLTNIMLFACWMSRKTPVMLNWTVGRKNLEHAVNISGLEKIITSARFLDRVDNIDFGTAEPRLVFVEELKNEEIHLGEKVVAWWESRKKARRLYREWGLFKVRNKDTAVILFTSGSESAPKGVPLSHINILQNIRGALDVLPFHSKSTLYGFLPPFHSFGLTITTVFPMLAGIRTAYHPNPTESRQIAKGIARYGITLLCGTPTFVSGIFKAANQRNYLKNLEFIITGAEKLPDNLKSTVRSIGNVEILEGYGITECSPVISINRPCEEAEGVGKPLDGVSLRIVDPSSMKPLVEGERGLILVSGENVFRGYLGIDKNPFLEMEGALWYDTGDLGYLTPSGNLILAGRMKRFIKVGGEMISLPAVEDVFIQKWVHDGEGPAHAVEALEIEGQRPELWLFTVLDLGLDAVNEELRIAGFSNLCRIKKVLQLPEIPCLGTGKVNYPKLRELIN